MTKLDYIKIYEYINNNLLDSVSYSRFKKCNCFISDDTVSVNGNSYKIIKSYKTFVAFVDIENDVFVEIGRFSSTTSKQCTQVYKTYYRNCQRLNCECDIDFYKYDFGTFC